MLMWRESDASWSTLREDVPLSDLRLTPACCGRARCALLRGSPWNSSIELQEKLVNACRALRSWNPRVLAEVTDDHGKTEPESHDAPWDEVCELDREESGGGESESES